MSELAIDARDVTKVYGEGSVAYHALRGVNFAARRGEFVMLSGPSGSGKTTLLSILGCVLRASGGTVRLYDTDITAVSDRVLPALRLSHVGFIFQGHNLIASLSVRDNVSLLLELRGWSRRDAHREAHRLLEGVGLGALGDRDTKDLSGGQRQRVAIARALAGAPPVILADEPTASLDAQSGLLVTETLKALATERGHTVVVVTHDNRIFHLADRIVHIEDGRIVPKVTESSR
jgi:putative ABC transport system ATP-binding protein